MANSTNLVVHLQGKDDLSKTIENVRKEIQDVSNTSTKLEGIRKKFDTITNSSAPLNKRIRDIKKEMEKLTLSGEKATKEGQEMYRKLSEAAKQYDLQLRQIQQDTKGVGESSKFDVKGLANGISSNMGLGNMGTQVMSAVTNPYVLAGTAIVGATKALYDYNKELDRSLQKTAQFTGLTGDELMSLRNGIKSVSDTFGKDYDTVLSSVDGLMAQFGINGEEALQLVRDGFVSGADEGGRMLDMIKSYSGAFNDAGISASEMVAIISNTRSGIFSEEGMSLIAKGATKIREFSDNLKSSLEGVGIDAEEMYRKLQSGEITTVQALQSISNRLKDLNPQTTEVGNVLKQVFGKEGAKAGIELVTALSEVNTNLEDCKNQTGEWGKAMQQLQEADRELENALSTLFGISEGGFSTMSTKLKAEVYGAVAKVINSFIDWYNKSIILRGAIANIALQFKNAWEIIKGILKIFMNSIQSLSQMIEGVFNLDWNQVKQGWSNGVKNILQNISDGFANVKENINDSIDQTLNGNIKKLEVPVEVEYSENKHKGEKINYTEKQDNNKNNKKGSKGKTEEIIDVKSLKYAQEQLRKLQEERIKIPVDATDKLEENSRLIKKWEKEIENRKILLEINTNYTDEKLKSLQKELKSLFDKKENINIDDNKLKEIDKEIKKVEEEINKKLSLDIDVDFNEINKLYSQLEDLKNERIKLNQSIDYTGLKEIDNEIENINRQIDERRKLIIETNKKDIEDLDNEIIKLQQDIQEKYSLGFDINDKEIIDLENQINNLLEKKNLLINAEVEDEEIISLQDKLNNLKQERISITSFVDDNDIKNKLNEIQSRKVELYIETDYDENSINELRQRIKELQDLRYTISPNDTETIKLLNDEIKKEQKQLENVEMALGIKPYIEPNSRNGIQKEIQEINNELSNMDISLNPQRYNELIKKLIDAEDRLEELNKELSTVSTPSVKSTETKRFEKGSIEDKRQSLNNANERAEQVRTDLKLGLIGQEEAKEKLNQIREELQAQFPNLDIDLKFNMDGTITSKLEDIEKKAKDIGETSSYIGQLGSAFSQLGSAIGGAGGEIVNFGGQVISQGAQMVGQMAQIIAANQAAAMAKGIESASGLMFPFNLAAIATVVATIASMFASLPKFEKGGVVGGTSYTSDRVIARLNSGEGVLTRKGVSNLHNIFDNSNNGGGKVEFVIDGRQLKGVLNNYNSKLNRQS